VPHRGPTLVGTGSPALYLWLPLRLHHTALAQQV
jgi:hypothetical protein